MHAADLVGINGITRVLLVYICQQGVYSRGHVLPLRLPRQGITSPPPHQKKTINSLLTEIAYVQYLLEHITYLKLLSRNSH
jgi:hypothetical protein